MDTQFDMNEINVDACFQYIQTQADNHAFAKSEIIRTEAKLKATKAALMEASDQSSIAMREADAYRDIRYMEVAVEIANATREEAKLNTLIKAAFAKLECFRADLYTKRQELKNLP